MYNCDVGMQMQRRGKATLSIENGLQVLQGTSFEHMRNIKETLEKRELCLPHCSRSWAHQARSIAPCEMSRRSTNIGKHDIFGSNSDLFCVTSGCSVTCSVTCAAKGCTKQLDTHPPHKPHLRGSQWAELRLRSRVTKIAKYSVTGTP